jgi:LysR family transcriptional activator of glutamate synthase operon
MELRQLRSVMVIAEEAQFSRAATRLGISQPSLSVQIGRLERELGLTLFDRSSRQLQLTQAGAVLVSRSRSVLSELDDITDELQSLRDVLAGEVTLGVTKTPGPCDLLGLLQGYHSRYQGVDLAVREGLSVDLAEQLRHDRLDLALLSEVPGRPWTGLDAAARASEPLVMIMPERHPMAERKRARLDELADEVFISFPRGATIRDSVEQAARDAGFVPRVAFESTEVTRIRALASVGLGIGILPASDAASPGPTVAIVPFDDPDLAYCVALCRRRGRRVSPAARALLDLARLTAFEMTP